MPIENIQELEKVVNSELTSKIIKSSLDFDQLLIETKIEDLIDVIQFLKSNDNCKFRQLIDIAGVDFLHDEKRFKLIYLMLSHENNLRIKISIHFEMNKKIPSIVKIFPSANWMEREVFDIWYRIL